jgi:hypothetical protein
MALFGTAEFFMGCVTPQNFNTPKQSAELSEAFSTQGFSTALNASETARPSQDVAHWNRNES